MSLTFFLAASWGAVFIGFAGTWIAGRHRSGWLLGCVASILWLCYDIYRDIPAGSFAAIVAIGLNMRNYLIGGKHDK